jgi:hypothetical protein
MSSRYEETSYISISLAVRRSGVSEQLLEECVERRLVHQPLTDADVAELRRIRRLQELGINLPGIEVILHMRRRIQALQFELQRAHGEWPEPTWPEMEQRWQRLLPSRPEDR